MNKIGIYDELKPELEEFLTLIDEEDTIDLDVVNSAGDFISTLLQINKETLKISVVEGVEDSLGFETDKAGAIEIYNPEKV